MGQLADDLNRDTKPKRGAKECAVCFALTQMDDEDRAATEAAFTNGAHDMEALGRFLTVHGYDVTGFSARRHRRLCVGAV